MASLYLSALLNEADDRKNKEKRRWNRYSSNRICSTALALTEKEFINKYRLSRNLYHKLVEQLSPIIEETHYNSDLSVNCKVLLALSFYATGQYQRHYGSHLTQHTVSTCVKEVTEALNNKSVLSAYMKFPLTIQERNMIKSKFQETYRMPGIIGCIDGTHIAMRRPEENREHHLNEQQYYSKNVQVVCDYDLNIINVDALIGGAKSDEYVFNQHPLKIYLESLINQRETVCLIGDAAYTQREYMMTPIRNACTGSPEDVYNKTHSLAREKIEKTICLLKARWCCLQEEKQLNFEPEMVTKIVYACCALHNMCNRAGITTPPKKETLEQIAEEQSSEALLMRKGVEARLRLVNTLWSATRENT